METWNPDFPVGQLKRKILDRYSGYIGYSILDYDVEINRDINYTLTGEEVAKSVKYLSIKDAIDLRDTFLDKNKPVCLSIGYPGHAVAYIAHQDSLYIFDTQKTDTTQHDPSLTYSILCELFNKEFKFIDVLKNRPNLNIQTENDNLCVIWMIFILECVGYIQKQYGRFDPDLILKLITVLSSKAGGSLEFIEQIADKYDRSLSAFSSGGMSKMSCGDMKGGGELHEDIAEGGRRNKKWIQTIVKKMDKGAFTKQSLRHNETPLEYAKDVVKHPRKHTLKTRRRAQFLLNISKRKATRKVSHRK